MASKGVVAAKGGAGGAAAGGSGGGGGTKAVAELLDAIVKKATFKQLAGYSINSLSALLNSSRIGWDIMAKAAWDLHGIPSVIGVLQRYVTDSELLKAGINACKAMAVVAPAGTVGVDVITVSVSLLQTVWRGELSDGEKVGVVADMLGYVMQLARKSTATLSETGILDLLDSIADKLAAGWAPTTNGPIAVELYRLVVSMVQTRDGLAAVMDHSGLFAHLLAAALTMLHRGSAAGAASAPAAGAKGGAGASTASSASASAAQHSTLRLVLDPVLRLLDRVSRVQEGSRILRASDALSAMLPIADWWLHATDMSAAQAAPTASASSAGSKGSASGAKAEPSSSSTGREAGIGSAVVLELFNRVVDADVARLVAIAGGRDASSASTLITGIGAALTTDSIHRREAAARMLARLCEIPDRVSSVGRDKGLLTSVVALLLETVLPASGTPPLALATPLVAVIVRVVERGTGGVAVPGLQVLLQVGALPALLQALTVATLQPSDIASDACNAACMRALYAFLTAAGEWRVGSDNGLLIDASNPAGGAAEGADAGAAAATTTVAAYTLAFSGGAVPAASLSTSALAHRVRAPLALPASAGTITATTPANLAAPLDDSLPLLVRLLASSLSAAVDVPAGGLAAWELPLHASRLASAFYAMVLLRELVFASTIATAPVPGSTPPVALDLSTLRVVIPNLCATLTATAAMFVAQGGAAGAASGAGAAQASSAGSAGAGGDASGSGAIAGWLTTGSCTLGVEIAVALASTSQDVCALLTHGIQRPLHTVLQGRDLVDDLADVAANKPIGTTAAANAAAKRRAGAGGGSTPRPAGGAGATGGGGAAAAAASVAAIASAARTGMGWLAAFSQEQPQWVPAIAMGGSSGSKSPANVTKAATLGADALYLSGSLMAYLVAHAQNPVDAGSLPPSVLVAIGPLAALADVEAGIVPARTLAARGPQETIRQAVNAGLQAALVTYSQFSSDAVVYAHFKDLVEAAGVGAEEIIAATDTLRGCAAALKATILAAPTRSSANAGSAAVAGVLKPLEAHLEGSEMLVIDTADADAESSRAAAEASVRAKLDPKAKDYYSLMYELCTVARQKLLLLEAVSLSPFLAWGIVAINGVLPVVQIIHSLTAAVSIHNDIDAARAAKLAGGSLGTVSAGRLMERVDDVLKHAAVALAHLSRVAYELRASGNYAVDGEEEDRVKLPSTLDGHIVPLALFGKEVTGTVCTSVLTCLASGQRVTAFASSVVLLLKWMASIANVPRARNDTSVPQDWGARHVSQLLDLEYTEACVALLRFTMAQLHKSLEAVAAAHKAAASGGSSSSSTGSGAQAEEEAQAALSLHYESIIALVGNLQQLASSKVGATAIATRGGSRQILRAVPMLLGALSTGDKASPAYRALVGILRVLNTAIASGGAERNLDDTGDGGGSSAAAMSVGALLHKQGLIDTMVSVVFSPVGITSAAAAPTSAAAFAIYGEACQLALAIVSAVSVRKDVLNAVAILSDTSDKVAAAVAAYNTAAATEAGVWQTCASSGPSAISSLKRATLQLEALAGGSGGATAAGGAGASGESGAADAGDEDKHGGQQGSLLSAVQLFGVLIVTEAGRRSGVDTTSQGLAACASLAQSANAFAASSARLNESVMAAISAATTSTDDKPAPALPAAFANAAAAALAPPSKNDRDMLWTLVTATSAVRVTLGVLLDMAVSVASASGQHDLTPGAALTHVASTNGGLAKSLGGMVDTLLNLVDTGNGNALHRLAAVASGAALTTAVPSKAKGIVPVPVPSPDSVVAEAVSTLGLAAVASTCARQVPAAVSGRGVDVCLAAMASAAQHGHSSGNSGSGSSGGGNQGSGGNADSGRSSTSAMEIVCHVLTVLNGIAQAGEDMLPILSAAAVTAAVMRVLGDVLQSASSSSSSGADTGRGGDNSGSSGSGSSDDSSALAIGGTTAACGVLAALAGSARGECDEMIAAGITSFLRSATALCGDEVANTACPPRPALLQALALLLTRLANVGNCAATPATVSVRTVVAEDGTETTVEDEADVPLTVSLRDMVVRILVTATGAKAYIDALAGFHAVLRLVLCFGEASDWMPASTAARTVSELQAEASKAVPAIRRAMANANASAQLVTDGKAVIDLLTPKKPEGEAAATGDGADEAAAEEAVDEVLEAVALAYSKLGVLHDLYAGIDERAAMTMAEAVEQETGKLASLDDCLDSIRALSLVIPPYYPAADADDPSAVLGTPKATRATVWQVFCTARDYVTSVLGLLANEKSSPRSPKLLSGLFDVVTACIPIMSRMSVFAEGARQRIVAAYWSGQSTEWELSPELDVPMNEAVAGIGLAIDSHLIPAERTLRQGIEGMDSSSGTSYSASYRPATVNIEQVCKCIKNLVHGAGHEAVAALVKAGQLTNTVRLISAMRMMKERASDTQAKGDKDELRAIAADADRCVAALGGVIRFIATKGQTEVQAYCAAGERAVSADELRDVAAILPPAAIAGLLRASALLSVQAAEAGGEDDDDDEEEGAAAEGGEGGEEKDAKALAAAKEKKDAAAVKARAADAVLEAQVRAIMSGKQGLLAIFGLLEEVGSQTLAAATLAGETASPFEARVQLKLFHTTLTVLNEQLSSDAASVPANMTVLRGLYASIINAMQVVMGESFTSATHAAALASLYHDPVAEEFAEEAEARKGDAEIATWVAAPDAAKLTSSKQEDAVVEEL